MSPQFDLYKTKGALQMDFIPPTFTKQENGYTKALDRTGAFYLQMAPSKGEQDSNGNNVFDWQNKTTIGIGVSDIILVKQEILKARTASDNKKGLEVKLIHKNNQKTISLQLKSGSQEGTYFLSIGYIDGDKKASNSVPLSQAELNTILSIWDQSLIYMIGIPYLDPVVKTVK